MGREARRKRRQAEHQRTAVHHERADHVRLTPSPAEAPGDDGDDKGTSAALLEFVWESVAALVLLGHALEFAWLVLPAYYPHHWPLGWRSPVALLTLAAPGLLLIHRHRLRHAEDTP